MYAKDLSFVYSCPTKIVFGKRSYREVRAELGELGCKRALVVTDKPLAEGTDVVEKVKKALRDKLAGVFMDVEPDSSFETVNACAEYGREVGCDSVVSVGGGSAIDTAKCAAILLKAGGTLDDHVGVNLQDEPITPHISIPTTAGTGSEATHVAVIRNVSAGQKLFILDQFLFPNVAILDPELTYSLPATLTAATGMDALTHAIEARHGIYRNPVSDGGALHAIRMIRDHLQTCVEEPKDLVARGALLNAATLAGMAFANSMVGVVHAVAHSVGAVCHVHHGTANSILLPAGMRFNAEWEPDLYVPVAEALGVFEPGMSAAEASERAAARCLELAQASGLPTKLSEVGVGEDQLAAIADLSLGDGAILNNPRMVMDAGEVMGILKAVF